MMRPAGDWDPLKELLTVQKRMNKLFESALERTDFDAQDEVDSWTPVADVYESPEALVLCLELPGLEQEQIALRVEADELVVSGERLIDRERPEEQFHRVERAYGKFSRRFHLPSTVDRENVEATYRDGLLRVSLKHRGKKQDGTIHVAIR
jgi:HSP20 family protein